MMISSLFSGIGGFELGFRQAGHQTILQCEIDRHASQVLQKRFAGVSLFSDVTELERVPHATDVVTAGFPCQDLSMAGNKSGIGGGKSSIVSNLFRLLDSRLVSWVVIENVYFMLYLKGGRGYCDANRRTRESRVSVGIPSGR